MPPDVKRIVGRYEIVDRIGRGGMGVVHLARQAGLDRYVALKELLAVDAEDPAFAERFVREAKVAGGLSHPNIVTVFDYFEEDGTAFIAMEYLERGSLRPWVTKLDLAQVAGVLEGLLSGLQQAHVRGVVHRDLKPENLLLTSQGGIKIADFGIAKALNVVGTRSLTATGMALGSPTYMAPEQAMATGIGPWTDLYATGVIAYELLVGRVPFAETDTPMAILFKHVNEPIPSPLSVRPDLDPRLAAWLERLLAKEPGVRPPSAEAAWDAFEELVNAIVGERWRRLARLPEEPGQPAPQPAQWTPTPPEALTPPPPAEAKRQPPLETVVPATADEAPPPVPPHGPAAGPRRRRGWLIAVAGALAVVAAAVVGVVLLGGSDESAPKPRKARAASQKFIETFSDPSDSWFESQHDEESTASFDQGGYLVTIPKPDGGFSSANDFDPRYKHTFGKSKLPPSDARLSVDVTKLGGPNENTFGLSCMSAATEDEYDFLIDGTGYAAIFRWNGKKSITLRDWKKSPAIFKGSNATNHMSAECRAGRTPGRAVLTLAVNGHEVARAVEARGAPVTYFGLYAATYDTGKLRVLFDNFALRRL